MRPTFLVLCVLAGCTNPDEILPIRGATRSDAGTEGQTVRLLRTRFESSQQQQEQCDSALGSPFKEATANARGDYTFELFRIEARPFVTESTFCFRVDTTFPSGAMAWADFYGIFSETRVGTFYDWQARPTLTDGVLHFEPPIPWPDDAPPFFDETFGWRFGTQLDHHLQFLTSDGGLAWGAMDRVGQRDGGILRVPFELDTARLEDFEGAVTLHATLLESEFQSNAAISTIASYGSIELQAAERLPLAGSRVALSRGLPCDDVPCPFTDGDLTVVDAGWRESMSFELEPPRTVSRLVLRGAELGGESVAVSLTRVDGGMLEVESLLTSDGNPFFSPSYRDLVVLADGGYRAFRPYFVSIALDAGTPVRRVTVRFPDGLRAMRELSLFE